MGIYLRGKTYYIDYYLPNGRRCREPAGSSRKLAANALKKRQIGVVEGKYLDIRREQKTRFEDFAEEYLALHSKLKKSYYTDCKIVNLLKRHFSGQYLYEITSLDVERFKSQRAKEVSPATVNRALAVLKSMYNKAILWDRVVKNPCKGVKLFKENNQRLRFLEREEIEKLLFSCCEHLKPIVIVALNTGMRKSEILGLKWHDIDIKRNIIHLYDTKNGEKREVPMNDIVVKALVAVPKHRDSAYIFCNKDGESYGDIKKSWLTAVKKACIIDFHFHDLRHTFASQLVMAGVDLNTVRDLLGHKSMEMTLRYSHLSPDHKQRAVDVLAKRIVTNWTQEQMPKVDEKLATSQSFENTVVTI